MQELPFSQIVDANGLCEESVCNTEVFPCEQECILRQNDSGATMLDLTCKLNCYVRCSSRRSDTIVTDAYSVEEPLLCNAEPLQFLNQGNRRVRRYAFQEFASVPDGLVSIEDQWCDLKSIDLREGKDGVNVCCHMTVCMIGRNADGQLGYYERVLECNTLCEYGIKDASVRIISALCTLNGNQIRVQVDADLSFGFDDSCTISAVTGVMLDTTHAYTRPSATIRIVYAEDGESLWDIAKKHHSSVENICAENDLIDKTVHGSTMLMIPMM